jgi:hypothetical protein
MMPVVSGRCACVTSFEGQLSPRGLSLYFSPCLSLSLVLTLVPFVSPGCILGSPSSWEEQDFFNYTIPGKK